MIASVPKKQEKRRPGYVYTLQELSAAAGVSRRTVSDWVKLEGFPREADGSMSVWAVAQWNVRRVLESQATPADETKIGRLKRQRLALDNADRRLKLRVRAGELVSRTAVMAFFTQFVHAVRSRLLAVPAESTSSIPPEHRAEVIADMEQRIHLVLREMEGLGDRLNGAADLRNGHGAA